MKEVKIWQQMGIEIFIDLRRMILAGIILSGGGIFQDISP